MAIAKRGIFNKWRLSLGHKFMQMPDMHPITRKTGKYPADMYLNVVQSVGTKMQKRVLDLTPAKKEVFWGWFREEVEAAEFRMKVCAGEISEVATRETGSLPSIPVNVPKKKRLPVRHPK